MTDVTMRQMLEAGVHFGHQTRYWCPRMAPYIFGERNKIHIINLEKTLPLFDEAMNFLGHLAGNRGKVLFVGTKRQASETVKQEAIRSGSPYVNHRWLGGMLTNFKTVRNSIERLKEIEKLSEEGALGRLSKKEALQINRERSKLERSLLGIKDMDSLPDVLLVIDVDQEKIAVAEANKLNIPVVAVVDTNCKPDGIDHLIPGNDDAIRAIQLYLRSAADAIIEGRAVGQVREPGDGDDYIEVDDSGQAVADGTDPVLSIVKTAAAPVIAVPADAAAPGDAAAPVDAAAPATAAPEAAKPGKKAAAENDSDGVTATTVVKKKKTVRKKTTKVAVAEVSPDESVDVEPPSTVESADTSKNLGKSN